MITHVLRGWSLLTRKNNWRNILTWDLVLKISPWSIYKWKRIFNRIYLGDKTFWSFELRENLGDISNSSHSYQRYRWHSYQDVDKIIITSYRIFYDDVKPKFHMFFRLVIYYALPLITYVMFSPKNKFLDMSLWDLARRDRFLGQNGFSVGFIV